MAQFRVHLRVFAAALPFLACASMIAQMAQDPSTAEGRRIASQAAAAPFSAYSSDSIPAYAIEYRSYDQMTAADRQIASNAEGSIGEKARYAGLEFNAGPWSYEQVLCPAMPRHLFLRFMRNDGKGDVSMFTASIPRGEQGSVRIIPIQMRGYSLFSPVPINSMTIAAFNRIRGEEDPDVSLIHNFVGTGLCYAALAGGHPRLGIISTSPEKEKYPVSLSASMELRDGAGVLSFTDTSPASKPVEWKMSFDHRGKLIKARRIEAPLISGVLYEHPLSPIANERVNVVPRPRKGVTNERVNVVPGPRKGVTVDNVNPTRLVAYPVAMSTPIVPAAAPPTMVTPFAPAAATPAGAMPAPVLLPAAPATMPAAAPPATPPPPAPLAPAPMAPAPMVPGEAAPAPPPQSVPDSVVPPAAPPQ